MRTDAGSTLWTSFTGALDQFFHFLPALFGAVIVLVVGWVVAKVVGRVLVKGLHLIGFERAVQSTGIGNQVNRISPKWTASRLVGELVRWCVFLLFVQAASNLLAMPQLTTIINTIVLFIPQLVVAIGIVVIGAWVARFVGNALRASLSRIEGVNPSLFARLAQGTILGFAVIAALSQLGIAPFIVNSLFIGLVATLALALGLAFGLGGRDVAARITQRWYEGGRRMADGLRTGGATGTTPVYGATPHGWSPRRHDKGIGDTGDMAPPPA
jgi:hypothetical protein